MPPDDVNLAPYLVAARLLVGHEPSAGPHNVGRWWRRTHPDTRENIYDTMTEDEEAFLNAAQAYADELRERGYAC